MMTLGEIYIDNRDAMTGRIGNVHNQDRASSHRLGDENPGGAIFGARRERIDNEIHEALVHGR